jgi:hypothetical protein
MNDDTTDLDQTDEDILIYAVSDEALEAAAGTTKGRAPSTHYFCSFFVCPAY